MDEQRLRIEKKITVATVLGGKPDIKKIIAAHEATGKALPLIECYGIATGTKAGSSDMGPFVKLIGLFQAVNLETGEKTRAGVCILPAAANDLVAGALGFPTDARGVEFGFRLSAIYDVKSATNYVYVVEAMHQIQDNDPLAMLAARIKNPALAAPVTVPVPVPVLHVAETIPATASGKPIPPKESERAAARRN